MGRLAKLRSAWDERLYDSREFLGAARHVRASSFEFRGSERYTGEPLGVRYFGSGQSLDYLLDKLYAQPAHREPGPRRLCLGASRFLREPSDSMDLTLVELPWPYYRLVSGSGFLRVPGYIVQKLPLADTWDQVKASFRKNTRTTDLRKVRRFELDYRLTSEPRAIEHFYREMYEPYAQQRFGELALVDPLDELCYFGSHGWLLEVLHRGTCVGGVILYAFNGSMHFLWIGLPSDLDPPLFDAAFSGIYYFSILHAYREGCREIDLSYTRPLLTNGIYNYKRKWGAHVCDDWKLGEIWLRPSNLDTAVRSALSRNPWIIRRGGRLIGKLLVDDAAAQSIERVRELALRYDSPGMASLELCSVAGFPAHVREAFPKVEFRELGDTPEAATEFCRDECPALNRPAAP